ncbi:MATE family efflux transporter [Lentilitoribacter sp. Alg239-R112]|uniref:MATE family efflux transporter n=1 Tax=Lentilitoribacter sp. Alg239-R112 TaxID=2305987 RepID=UPI0013A6CDC7|nr:MATE family efflux transporter [Lentilitoribacter sp. Alg239-R112]
MSAPHQKNRAEIRPFEVTNKLVFSIALPMTLAFLTTPLLGLVDVAVVGQLGSAALLGGLAISVIIFDLIFGTFNFLRSATTGLVAQSFGRGDEMEQQATFWRSSAIAIVLGIVLIIFQNAILTLGLVVMDASANVSDAATRYFDIRILSAPATLMNYAVLGYVLGQGKGRLGLFLQLVLYVTNIALSIFLGLNLGWGLEGVAWATVIAEYFGVLIGLVVVVSKFLPEAKPSFLRIIDGQEFRKLMSLNGDIMIRSFALVTAFAWFTRQGGQFGDQTLAANAILINFVMIAGYFLDGIATAAEQLAGRSIGANYKPAFIKAIKLTVIWSFILAGVLFVFFWIFGNVLIDIITTEEDVRRIAKTYYLWAALIAFTGVVAFQMDGVYIGATWSQDMRNMMLLSLAVFIISSLILATYWENHGLWVALNIFMGIRGISLTMILPRKIKSAYQNVA